MHSFWDTQPIMGAATDSAAAAAGPINADLHTDIAAVQDLPAGFAWAAVDVRDVAQLADLTALLARHYVADEAARFRLQYSADTLAWALRSAPVDWCVGVRATDSGRLLAFIAGVPMVTHVDDSPPLSCVGINFLCAHSKLRGRRLTPVLIREVTRRVLSVRPDMQYAVYTSGTDLPGVVATRRILHRPLNIRALLAGGFTQLPPRMTVPRMERLYKVSDKPPDGVFRRMTPDDVPAVTAALNAAQATMRLRRVFTLDDVAAEFLHPAVHTYVGVADASVVVSWYHVGVGESVTAAVAHYTAGAVPWDDVFALAAPHADVFNVLQGTAGVADLSKVWPGSGLLKYYVFNWRCSGLPMAADAVGVVLP
jgi:glycylpeptide N-tetradecanoyltransferase